MFQKMAEYCWPKNERAKMFKWSAIATVIYWVLIGGIK